MKTNTSNVQTSAQRKSPAVVHETPQKGGSYTLNETTGKLTRNNPPPEETKPAEEAAST